MEGRPMRWLYHALPRDAWLEARAANARDGFAPASLGREGFVHASYRDRVVESARLYLPQDRPIAVLQIDPRLLVATIDVAETPRGPMPHVHGAIAWGAITRVWDLADLEVGEPSDAPDYLSDHV